MGDVHGCDERRESRSGSSGKQHPTAEAVAAIADDERRCTCALSTNLNHFWCDFSADEFRFHFFSRFFVASCRLSEQQNVNGAVNLKRDLLYLHFPRR